jgi:hypothetical protein
MPFYDNVEINVIFKCEEDADEVMAVYQTVTMRDDEGERRCLFTTVSRSM